MRQIWIRIDLHFVGMGKTGRAISGTFLASSVRRSGGSGRLRNSRRFVEELSVKFAVAVTFTITITITVSRLRSPIEVTFPEGIVPGGAGSDVSVHLKSVDRVLLLPPLMLLMLLMLLWWLLLLFFWLLRWGFPARRQRSRLDSGASGASRISIGCGGGATGAARIAADDTTGSSSRMAMISAEHVNGVHRLGLHLGSGAFSGDISGSGIGLGLGDTTSVGDDGIGVLVELLAKGSERHLAKHGLEQRRRRRRRRSDRMACQSERGRKKTKYYAVQRVVAVVVVTCRSGGGQPVRLSSEHHRPTGRYVASSTTRKSIKSDMRRVEKSSKPSYHKIDSSVSIPAATRHHSLSQPATRNMMCAVSAQKDVLCMGVCMYVLSN